MYIEVNLCGVMNTSFFFFSNLYRKCKNGLKKVKKRPEIVVGKKKFTALKSEKKSRKKKKLISSGNM